MAQTYSMDASIRTMTGKRVRKLRANGEIPGIIYGTVVPEPIPVTIGERELIRTWYAIGASTLLDLKVDGNTYTVYMRNIHMHPVKRSPFHVEFFAPDLLVAMTAHIPIHLVGESPAQRLVVMQTRDWVELRGLPANLPGAIDVDISVLEEVDDSIFMRELILPADVELLSDPDEMIVRLTEPQLIEEEEEVEGEEVEGEEVEGKEGAEAADQDEAESGDEPEESGD